MGLRQDGQARQLHGRVRYRILDPTGNITALVESEVDVSCQPAVAARIMERHPEVEQVGFVHSAPDGGAWTELRMAGGEFCGNATMCAAVLHLIRREDEGEWPILVKGDGQQLVTVCASGAARPVEVLLTNAGDGSYAASVVMPPALCIERVELADGEVCEMVPLVRMEGISHLVIEPDSTFFSLRADRPSAEQTVRRWCHELRADGLGLMFLEGEGSRRTLTPLIYVPGSNTVFWENSCASGSSAVGMYLAEEGSKPVDLALTEPGGVLRVQSDPGTGETRLFGKTRLMEEHSMSLDLLPPEEGDPRLSHVLELLEEDPALVERVETRERRWHNGIFDAELWEVRQPDGQVGERDIVLHHGGAGVCAVRDGKMCLVRQYRVALGRMTLEIPAGKIDPGEDPAVCAARELAEETGLIAERLVRIAVSRSAPGFTNEATRIFYAEGLSQHPARPDSDEFVDVVWLPVDEVVAAVRAGLIEDAKTVISALFAASL